MESVEKITAIADKIYLWEEFSESDLNYFYKYLKKVIPSRYVWDKDDCISESILKLKERYDITKDTWWKKKCIENMIKRVSLYSIRDAIHYYEWDNKDDIIDEFERNWDKVETQMLFDEIINVIENIRPLYSPIEQQILDYNILWWETLIEVARRNNISLALASLIRKRITTRIKKCIDFYQ